MFFFFFLGTIRLWHLPDCVQINLLQSKTFLSFSKEMFYDSPSNSDCNNDSSCDFSPIDYSIWKLDATSFRLTNCKMKDVFIVFSIYVYRIHSIYITSLSELDKSTNQQYKLTFNAKYGTIIDYCFSSKEFISNTQCYLYILFDSNLLFKINLLSILSYDKSTIFGNDAAFSTIINTNQFHFINNITTNENIFKQLFKIRNKPGNCSYYKRKNERIEQQEDKRRKQKQIVVISSKENNHQRRCS